jgi:hypothetical protein
MEPIGLGSERVPASRALAKNIISIALDPTTKKEA